MTPGDSREDSGTAGWPVEIRGVTESIVTTLGPNERWNVAALGLHEAVESDDREAVKQGANGPVDPAVSVRATTFGNTRTRRNFHRQGGGYVQFTSDPVCYVEAALSIREEADPILDSADAWVRVEADHVDTDATNDSGDTGETTLEHWQLRSIESRVVRECVPTTNRGYNAVVEATVAASRLDVDAYDTDILRDRLSYFEEVCRTCGGEREHEAFDRLNELVDW